MPEQKLCLLDFSPCMRCDRPIAPMELASFTWEGKLPTSWDTKAQAG